MRMQLMIESLAQAIERAGSTRAADIAAQLEKAEVKLAGQTARMRAADHQFQQPLAVAVMDRQGSKHVKFDVEGSGYGFRVIRQLTPQQAEQPHTCTMQRP
jgi:branched-chain amino acid transport system substrate-binding protein